MKKLLVVIISALLCLPILAYGQGNTPVFSVKINPDFQAAQFGLDMGSLQPYIGLDYIALGAKASVDATIDMSDYYYYYGYYSYMPTTTQPTTITVSGEVEGKASLLMPFVGVKFFMSQNPVRPYLFGSVFKSFPSVSLEMTATMDGESQTEDILGDKGTDFVKDMLDFWGVDVGIGAEWTINEHFSIGGEYGVKFLMMGAEYVDEEGDLISSAMGLLDLVGYSYMFKGVQDVGSSMKLNVSSSLRTSHAAVVLNFHF